MLDRPKRKRAFPQRLFGKIITTYEYPEGVYIDKHGNARPDVSVTYRTTQDEDFADDEADEDEPSHKRTRVNGNGEDQNDDDDEEEEESSSDVGDYDLSDPFIDNRGDDELTEDDDDGDELREIDNDGDDEDCQDWTDEDSDGSSIIYSEDEEDEEIAIDSVAPKLPRLVFGFDKLKEN